MLLNVFWTKAWISMKATELIFIRITNIKFPKKSFPIFSFPFHFSYFPFPFPIYSFPFPIPHSPFPIPCSLSSIPYSLFSIPYSLFPIPYSLFVILYSPFAIPYSPFLVFHFPFLIPYSRFIPILRFLFSIAHFSFIISHFPSFHCTSSFYVHSNELSLKTIGLLLSSFMNCNFNQWNNMQAEKFLRRNFIIRIARVSYV